MHAQQIQHIESCTRGSCDIRWKTLPLLKHYEISCVNLDSIARSGQCVALLQGIAESASALPDPFVAVVHDVVTGRALPPHST